MEYLNLVERLQQISGREDVAIGILMRHAEREPILAGKDAHLAQLTDSGRESAHRLGRDLAPFHVKNVYASVIERCIDTGNQILSGAGRKGQVIADSALSIGYIDDWDLAQNEFVRRDPSQIVLDYLGGEDIPGFGTIKAGSERLLSFVTERMMVGKTCLFVTHDALAMPFLQHFAATTFSNENWFPVLGSIVITQIGNNVYINGSRVTGGVK